MKSCIPRFNSQRMVVDYVTRFYARARKQSKRFAKDNAKPARDLAQWKNKIRKHWSQVSVERIDTANEQIQNGESLPIRIRANLDGLAPEDIMLECLVGTIRDSGKFSVKENYTFQYVGNEDDKHIFELDLKPHSPGLNHYKIRIYPYHKLLSHPFELGFMLWV